MISHTGTLGLAIDVQQNPQGILQPWKPKFKSSF